MTKIEAGSCTKVPTQRLVEDIQLETDNFRWWHIFRLCRGLNQLRKRCGPLQSEYLRCWSSWKKYSRFPENDPDSRLPKTFEEFCGEYQDELRACLKEIAHETGAIRSSFLAAAEERDSRTPHEIQASP